ncbi:OPT/YSL family transporter [Archangium violaceum]|uniref:OPT/YSL family transporter n=1 Tax=Archangium violaceum TaxID=83451 RepID=UPI0036DB7E47
MTKDQVDSTRKGDVPEPAARVEGLPHLVGAGPQPSARGEPLARALVVGSLIGVVLAVSNVYMGLKLGLWESGNIIASLLAFGGMTALSRWKGTAGPSAGELQLAQSVATSAGIHPATAGLMGAIPALALMGATPPGWAVVLWGVGLGTLGVWVAFVLRRRLLEEEALPFPTGVATADLISTLRDRGETPREGARGLGWAGVGAAGVTWLREGLRLFPGSSFFPGRLGDVAAEQLQLGVGWSPLLLGLGVLVGPHVGVSLLLGALVAWGLLAPWLVREGRVATSGFEHLVTWLTWPGVGLMVGAAVVTFAALGRLVPALGADVLQLWRRRADGERRVFPWQGSVVPLAVLLVLILGSTVFGLRWWHLLLALVLLLPLCTVGARAAGQTDISPVATIGALQQAAFGAVAQGQPALSVVAGSVVAGPLASTSVGLWSLQAGRLLGVSVPRQFQAQWLGVLLGAAVSLPTYVLLVRAHGLGTPELPVPSALQFQAMAEVSARGLEGLPPFGALAAGLGLLAGILLSLLARGRLERFVPSAVAVGIGFLVPAYYSVTICLGALLAAGARRVWPASAPVSRGVGAGLIIGESLMGVLLALLGLLGLASYN